jgi:hypothetical protein
MNTERGKMLAGEMYNALDPELVQARERARDLCQILYATREGGPGVANHGESPTFVPEASYVGRSRWSHSMRPL